jgi:hypothetical protein
LVPVARADIEDHRIPIHPEPLDLGSKQPTAAGKPPMGALDFGLDFVGGDIHHAGTLSR